MFDLPPDLPRDYPEAVCIKWAAERQSVPEEVLWAIRLQEGGRRGLVRTNSNNSYDVGVMQINSTHFKEFSEKWGVKSSWLTHSNCISIFAGAYILRRELNRTNDFWRGVGSYNSRTPSVNAVYQQKIRGILSRHKGSIRSMVLEAQSFQKPSDLYKQYVMAK